MAHKTLIGGTAYEITGGKTLIGGTGYGIAGGRTLAGGTGYDVSFSKLPAEGTPLSDCTWEQVQAVAQAGVGSQYFKVGDKKTLNLSKTILGATSIEMEIVSLGQDGANTITFGAVACFPTKVAYGSTIRWTTSTLRTVCQDIYNSCDANGFILAVTKGQCNGNSAGAAMLYDTDHIWIPSVFEVFGTIDDGPKDGAKEITQGSGMTKQYTKFSNSSARMKKVGTKYQSWRLRSMCYWYGSNTSSNRGMGVSENGASTGSVNFITTDTHGFAPFFVIG